MLIVNFDFGLPIPEFVVSRVKLLIGKMRKKTRWGPGSKRARAAAEDVEAIVELGEIENPALVVEQEEKPPSFKSKPSIIFQIMLLLDFEGDIMIPPFFDVFLISYCILGVIVIDLYL